MKNRIDLKLLILLVSTLVIALTGCHKTDSTAQTGTLRMHLHTDIDTFEVDSLGKLYPDPSGRPMSITKAQFYISNVQILNTAGAWVSVQGAYILKRYEEEDYTIGNVPAGNYTDIRFDIGIDSATNATPPSAHATGGADSSLTHADMYFGSASGGYIFMYLTGNVMVAGSPTPYSYKIGGSTNRKTVTMPTQAFTVIPGQEHFVHLLADYGKLIQSIDMTITTNRNCDATTNPATATTVSSNFTNFISYEM